MARLKPGLIIGLLFCLVAAPAQARFWDVADDHPYGEAIDTLMRAKVIRGYNDRSFQAERAVSRIEFIKIIATTLFSEASLSTCLDKLSTQPEVAAKFRFDDISYFDWYGPTLCASLLAGLVEGYEDGLFRPHIGINFAEGAKILAKAFDLELPVNHNDPRKIWYRPFVEDLGAVGAIPPTIRQFGQPLNRGEVAEMIYRISFKHRLPTANDRTSLQYDDIAGTQQTKTFANEDLKVALVYPSQWPDPYVQDRNVFTNFPASTATARIYLGKKKTDCYGFGECIERYHYLDVYPKLDLEVAGLEIRLNPDIVITKDELLDDVWTMVYAVASEGCEHIHALMMTLDYSYRLTAECVNEEPLREDEFRQMLQGLRVLQPDS